MIGIKSKRGQQNQRREFVLMMQRIEAAWSKELSKVLARIWMSMAATVAGGSTSVRGAIIVRKSELRKLHKKYYRLTASAFTAKLFRSIGKSIQYIEGKSWWDDEDEIAEEILDVGRGPIERRFWKRWSEWSDEQATLKVSLLEGTMLKMAKRIIERGMKEERTHREIAKVIAEKSDLSMWQALRIARTETHTAAVASVQTATETTGEIAQVEFNKYWVAAEDDRTRDGHYAAAMDYGIEDAIPMNMPYFVDRGDGIKEKLMYPGDPNGSPGNIINCRCVELYTAAVPARKPVAVGA